MYFFHLRKCPASLVTDNANQQKRWEHNKHNSLRVYVAGKSTEILNDLAELPQQLEQKLLFVLSNWCHSFYTK